MGELHLLKGADPVLLAEEASEVVGRLVGDSERDQVLEDFTGDEYELGAVVLAATTVSMFGERVVVARNLGRFGSADEVAPLVELVGELPEDTSLVLVWSPPESGTGKPVPKKLADAVTAAGGQVHDCGVPAQARAKQAWLEEQFAAAPVKLSAAARRAVGDHLGDDVARLGGILAVLEEVHGAGAKPLDVADVEPYLGEGGDVPPWELTDAIDKGDVPGAVDKVRRMLGGGGRHPLVLMATLQNHVLRMLRLDGADVATEKDAAQLLGMKGSTFPAKKALEQSRRLGTERLLKAVALLAAADVDLRGRTAIPGEQVLEVLVARLARLSASAGGGRRSRSRR